MSVNSRNREPAIVEKASQHTRRKRSAPEKTSFSDKDNGDDLDKNYKENSNLDRPAEEQLSGSQRIWLARGLNLGNLLLFFRNKMRRR